jgi:hypothetical protein
MNTKENIFESIDYYPLMKSQKNICSYAWGRVKRAVSTEVRGQLWISVYEPVANCDPTQSILSTLFDHNFK